MISKWEVGPAPSDKNPGRHKLLIKGEMQDIFLVVKKLGGLCSRPEKTSGDFNFLIYLAKLEPDTMAKIKSLAAEIRKSGERTPPRSATPFSGTEPFELPKPKIKVNTDPGVSARSPLPAERPSVQETAVTSEAASGPAAAQQSAKPESAAAKPEPAKPVPSPSQSAHTGRSGPFVPPSVSSRIMNEQPKPEEKPAPAPQTVEEVKPLVVRINKARWSVELPLMPTYTFQTLVSGSHNRFAHAAAMAVVENPGTIYNPLLIFGSPGTGKTHFIHSISSGLSATIGQDNIFVTDGIKLSKGVDLAIKDNSVKKLEEAVSKAKVLIIDDIHLLMVTESNSKYIAKWLKDFIKADKQIVVTSLFPPKSLGALEQSLGFQFTTGWMVDLKQASAQSYKTILNQLLQGMDVKLSEDELNGIFAARTVPFGEAIKALESMKKLEKFIVNAMNPASHAQLLDMLLGLSAPAIGGPLDDDEIASAQAWELPAKESWFKWGMYYPKGLQKEARVVLFKLHKKSAELGLNIDWQQVFMEEYNPDEQYGIPFKIGNFSSEKKAGGVIILGPQPTTALGAEEAEFRHLTMRILESYLIKGAWIQASEVKSQAAYVRALMDLV